MNVQERYTLWCTSPLVDEESKKELLALAGDQTEIEDRFYQELSFGTAGLRGILGPGDNRMNAYNVRKATEGLARYLTSLPGAEQKSVAIAYDSRRCSDVFARETACVLAAHGIQVHLFSTLHAVPQLSFTVRYLHCTAGVVITASHNPPKYNGYKVYWAHGGQVDPEQAEAITACIRQVPDFVTAYMPYEEALASGRITLIGREVDEAYYKATMSLLQDPEGLKQAGKDLVLVYTPLHGAGYVPVTTKAQQSPEYQDYLAREGADGVAHYAVKLQAAKLLLGNLDNTFVTPVFNGSASLRSAAGELIETVVKSIRRKQTVDDAFIQTLYSDTASLYRLDQITTQSTPGNLGPLPGASIALLVTLAACWAGIIGYVVMEKLKKQRK